ncbi:MAG TPA: hypothetical protein VMV49_05040 [Candidatus Deferrimicrobium sp.]|nr:hypothetical protein [Candidatus Deferrimicrobium sp.]
MNPDEDQLTTIKDELEELIFLIDPHIYISEYIPFGSNHIIAFNDELDSLGAVEGGLLTSLIDLEPRKSTFLVSDDLTNVKVTRFDPNDFIQFEANISYENVGGVQQLEDFGVHVDTSGRTIYGCQLVETVGKRDKHSLDNISRVIADLVSDSSRMMHNLLSTYQRRLLDLVYYGRPDDRNKFSIITARNIDPNQKANLYVDELSYQNELNQIVKQVYYGKDLKDGGKCFFGSEGMILVSKNIEAYDELIAVIGFFQGLDIFQKNYFSKMFMLWDEVRDARTLVDKSGVDPNAIGEAQVILSRVSSAVVLMNELLQFMQTAVNNITYEFQDMQPLSDEQEELAHFVQLRDTLKKATTRIEDASLIVAGLKDEIDGVNGLINTLSERQMRQMNEALKDSIQSMDDMTRSSERTGVALNILEVVLTGAIAFDIIMLFVGQYEWDPLKLWVQGHIFIWASIAISLFFLTGYGILRLIRHLEKRSEPNLRVSLKFGIPFLSEKFKAYIASKPVKQQTMTIRSGSRIHEYTWDDEDSDKWQGNDASISMYVDLAHTMLLSMTVNIDSPKEISTRDASQIIMNELIDAGVVPKETQHLLD